MKIIRIADYNEVDQNKLPQSHKLMQMLMRLKVDENLLSKVNTATPNQKTIQIDWMCRNLKQMIERFLSNPPLKEAAKLRRQLGNILVGNNLQRIMNQISATEREIDQMKIAKTNKQTKKANHEMYEIIENIANQAISQVDQRFNENFRNQAIDILITQLERFKS
jgi:hypothetical protein